MSHPLTHHVPIKHILLLFLLWGCFNVFSCLGTTLSITAYRGTNSVVSRRSESFLMTESQCEEIKTPMILHVVVATNGWFINVTQSSEWEQPQSVKARLFFFFFNKPLFPDYCSRLYLPLQRKALWMVWMSLDFSSTGFDWWLDNNVPVQSLQHESSSWLRGFGLAHFHLCLHSPSCPPSLCEQHIEGNQNCVVFSYLKS